ncbi:flavohemoglobin expression-modulating QEGLA motif protein [Alteromonas oceanisediminis]|uniref:flavohemoglobin expression-modulating QEGLA motif protein n=1 Tax=Alteromonas oceanisediminis TaxID=2836180 RepID=UPI001BDA7574|nr:flavohemoglobin expression-modulating QEGLA motif protein [Alteromonas oceanisediminis]MBT0586605.1 flavohemoglobin expression-modulating QEGLA motif protein [Alteromonas oceanisediminis]
MSQTIIMTLESVVKFDSELNQLVSGIEILEAVAPLNYKQQRQQFFDNGCKTDPQFSYRPQSIDAFGLKRQLFNLPIESLSDPDLVQLYAGVINSYVDKIDQCCSVGTPDFLYDSFRYYGEPSEKDIRNAKFVLHLPSNDDPDDPTLNAAQIEAMLSEFAHTHEYEYAIKLDDNMIANALVSGTTVKINSSARVTQTDAEALAHHELGVHLATTLNGRQQPLSILSLGCPANTKTQEGLAILSEYMGGCLTVSRLRNLALRVLAVESMIKEKSFKTTFAMLKEDYNAGDEQAFTVTARVYRGGGFTKDYVYLRGFHEMLNAYETSSDFTNLLAGKTSLDYLPTINRLIEKGFLNSPKFITPSFANPNVTDDIQTFIAHAIK